MKSRPRGRKVLRTLLPAIALGIALLVTFVGPWPTYGKRDLEADKSFRRALAAVADSASRSQRTARPGPLTAGWAKALLNPPIGTPLAGYGDRRGKPSTGVHDDLYVKALVLSDGHDTVALVAADMLIVPENIARSVREAVAGRLPLTADDLLFSASHTHSGPGAFGPGFAAEQFAGEYDPAVPAAIAGAFTEAIVKAYENRGPARLGGGKIEMPELVRNRARQGAVDPDLHFLLVENGGGRCLVVSYAAHATVIRAANMEMSGDYPGYLERAIERETGGMALFLAGAVGSMGPVPPASGDEFARAQAMGRILASRVLAELQGLVLDDFVDVASAGIAFQMPSFQVRLNRWLRLSPFLVRRLGVNNHVWLSGVRLDETVLVGTPSDFSGEISIALKTWAAARGNDLWVLSFNGDYIGYVSPDRDYTTASRSGREGYEMYLMSWCGPQQEEIFTRLIRALVTELTQGDGS